MSRTAIPSGSMLVGGEWLEHSSEGWREHRNPATGEVLGTFACGGEAEISRAVEAAVAAAPAWRATHPLERADLLLRFAELIRREQGLLSRLRTLEIGAPLKSGGRSMAGDYFAHFAGWADKIAGCTLPVGPRALDYTLPEPYGVVGVIIPWNGPVVSAGMKVAPALAAGNCVVMKPSELAPFSALRFAELSVEAGLPVGVLSVVPGEAGAGMALVSNPAVGKLSFTGGVATAQQVLRAAADTLKPVVLELGGKSAALVFEDADVELAVQTVVASTLAGIAGQACVLPTRLLVDRRRYDDVLRRLVTAAGSIRVGDPSRPDVQMGPVITDAAATRILNLVERATLNGDGRLLVGGRRLDGPLASGYFVEPTVFADVSPTSELWQSEIFGPVLSVAPFADEADAVANANSTPYGLGGFVFTGDLDRAHRVAQALDAGWIGVNAFPPMPANTPFGGIKQSGFGREGGLEGVLEFTRTKNVYVRVKQA